MSDNKTPKTVDIAEHLRALDDLRHVVERTTTKVKAELQHQHGEIEQLQLALTSERDAHDKTKAELDKTKQELSEARDKATNWQKRLREAEAKIDGAPKAVAEKWLEELGNSKLIGGLDRVIRGEAKSNPADFRKRLVNWFRDQTRVKPEEVIAVGRQVIEKDSKAAAQIEWSPDTPFRDDVDAVEIEITYAGLRFGEIVIERARGNVIEVITQPTKDASVAAAEAEAATVPDLVEPEIPSAPALEPSDTQSAEDPVSTSNAYPATPAAEPADLSVEADHSTEFVDRNSVAASDAPEAAQHANNHSQSLLPQNYASASFESSDEAPRRSEPIGSDTVMLSNDDYNTANDAIGIAGLPESDDITHALRTYLRKLSGKQINKQRQKELLKNDHYKSVLAVFAASEPTHMEQYLKALVDPRLRTLIKTNWPKA